MFGFLRISTGGRLTRQDEIISYLNDITARDFPWHAWAFYGDAYHMVMAHEARNGSRGGSASQLTSQQIAAVIGALADAGFYNDRAKPAKVTNMFSARPMLRDDGLSARWLRASKWTIKQNLYARLGGRQQPYTRFLQIQPPQP